MPRTVPFRGQYGQTCLKWLKYGKMTCRNGLNDVNLAAKMALMPRLGVFSV